MSCQKYIAFIEGQYGKLASSPAWNKLYMLLNEKAGSLYEDKTINVALSPINSSKNRYSNVFPCVLYCILSFLQVGDDEMVNMQSILFGQEPSPTDDDSRVLLQDEGSDYINASLITLPDLNTSYICCQGPLKETVDDFWLMVWQQKCRIILMLNNLKEKGRDKCYKYYSDSDHPVISGPRMKLDFKSEEKISKHFVKRYYELLHIKSGDSQQITQYHYTSWPDFGVPECPDNFLALLRDVRKNEGQKSGSELPPPLVVHCSAGLGRSGTYCLVDAVFNKMELLKSVEVDLCDTLTYMRKFRLGLIQTPQQLKFAFDAICVGIDQILTFTNAEASGSVIAAVNAHSEERASSSGTVATDDSSEYTNVAQLSIAGKQASNTSTESKPKMLGRLKKANSLSESSYANKTGCSMRSRRTVSSSAAYLNSQKKRNGDTKRISLEINGKKIRKSMKTGNPKSSGKNDKTAPSTSG